MQYKLCCTYTDCVNDAGVELNNQEASLTAAKGALNTVCCLSPDVSKLPLVTKTTQVFHTLETEEGESSQRMLLITY